MYLGRFEHQMDAKGRMRIPASFRKAFEGNDVVALKGSNRCIYIYRMDDLVEELSTCNRATFASENRDATRIIRQISSCAFFITQDVQYRFTISADLRKFADIKKDVVFLGVENRIELWAKEVWDEYSKNDDANYDDLLLALVKDSDKGEGKE